jgi:hypothetical protein
MSLALEKWRCHRVIDHSAGEVRRRFITDVPGQQAVYMEKRAEAAAFIAAHASSPGTAVPGPHLVAEAAATGKTPIALAAEVMANASAWLSTYSPAIEAARIGGKASVDAATTPEAARAARDAAVGTIQALFT